MIPWLIILLQVSSAPGNLTIREGGTYSGNFQNITVATAQPVIIENCTLRGPGPLISTSVSGVHLTIRNCSGFGENPNITGKSKGGFLDAYQPASLDIEHNRIEGIGGYGINVNEYARDANAGDTIKILYNELHDIDGRFSDGNGGWQNSGDPTPHAIILQHVHGVAGIEIGWNQIINEPGSSYVNDVINIFESSGTRDSHLMIHDNYIQGLYAIDPLKEYDSGCGIITDGSNDPAIATAFVEIANNQVISTGNGGICIAAGHDNVLHNNRILSAGRLPDGSAVFAQNIGCYIHPMNPADPGAFHGNGAYRNLIGWLRPPHTTENQSAETARGDWWLPDGDIDPVLTHDNIDWSGEITPETEKAELARWQKKLRDAGATVGPLG
ncbi:MAG: hypothetical protein ABSG31_02095 [Tepidisphaeraceae bacterium]|jgi:hypothetical protein